MAKIPFDIKYRPQIESGEYRVETKDGRKVRIVSWDKNGFECTEIVALITCATGSENCNIYTTSGCMRSNPYQENMRLFVVTPEPELSEFEERIFKLLRQYKECDIPLTPENIKAEASMLWPDFEKYFFDLYGKDGEGDSALRSFYYRGLADGKAEALKDLPRWEPNQVSYSEEPVLCNGNTILNLGLVHIHIDQLKKLPGFKED